MIMQGPPAIPEGQYFEWEKEVRVQLWTGLVGAAGFSSGFSGEDRL